MLSGPPAAASTGAGRAAAGTAAARSALDMMLESSTDDVSLYLLVMLKPAYGMCRGTS
jgi:hypothetical protein